MAHSLVSSPGPSSVGFGQWLSSKLPECTKKRWIQDTPNSHVCSSTLFSVSHFQATWRSMAEVKQEHHPLKNTYIEWWRSEKWTLTAVKPPSFRAGVLQQWGLLGLTSAVILARFSTQHAGKRNSDTYNQNKEINKINREDNWKGKKITNSSHVKKRTNKQKSQKTCPCLMVQNPSGPSQTGLLSTWYAHNGDHYKTSTDSPQLTMMVQLTMFPLHDGAIMICIQ